jgi:type IV pilus modification protein PilV
MLNASDLATPFLSRRRQRGMMLIEALVAILIVMTGILGIVGLMVKSSVWAGQAQYRTEAGMFASQIVQTVSLRVDRSSSQTLKASLARYSHQADQADESRPCAFSGPATSDTALAEILKAARGEVRDVYGLPGATAAMQQVKVDTDSDNKVTVTLCWKDPNDEVARNYQIHAFVH